MAEENVTLQVNFEGISSLKTELKAANDEYQKLINSGKATADQIDAAARRVGVLKEEIGDAAETAKALGSAEGKVAAIGRAAQVGISAFQGLQSAMALMGNEGEDLQKIFVKLQALMGIQQAIAGLTEAGDALNNLKAIGIATFGSLRGAIIATGIGALAVGIGLVIANFEELKTIVNGTKDELDALNQANTAVNDAMIEGSKNAMKEKASLDVLYASATDVNLSMEQRKRAVEKLQKDYPSYFGNIKQENILNGKAKTAYDSLSQSILNTAKARALEDKLTKIYADSLEGEEELVNKLKEAKLLLATVSSRYEDPANQKIARNAALQQVAAADAELREYRKNIEKKTKILTDEILKMNTLAPPDTPAPDKPEPTKTEPTKPELTPEEKKIAKERAADKARWEGAGRMEGVIEVNDLLLKTDVQFQEKATQIQMDWEQIRRADRLNNLEEIFNDDSKSFVKRRRALTEWYNEQIELNKDNAEKRKEIEETFLNSINEIEAKRRENTVDQLNATFDAINQLSNAAMALSDQVTKNKLANVEKGSAAEEAILRKQFENQKKMQVAMALINGAQAVTAILSVPDFTLGVASAIRIAAAAVTTGLTVAKIMSTQFEPSSSAGKGSKYAKGGLLMGRKHAEGGIMTNFGELESGEFVVNREATSSFLPMLEKINSLGSGSGTPNNLSSTVETNQLYNGNPPIIKTYVVASDVTTQQELQRKINNLARL